VPTPTSPLRRGLVAALALLAVATATGVPDHVAAAPATSGGFTTNARPSSALIAGGATLSVRADVTSATSRQALVDVEIYSADGIKVFQRAWDEVALVAGRPRTFGAAWVVPTGQAVGRYTIKIGIFGTGWSSLLHWNDQAASVDVVASAAPASTTLSVPTTTTTQPLVTTTVPPSTTTAVPVTTTTLPATTTTTTTPTTTTVPATTGTAPPPPGRFATLPVGAALPSDATCAARVRPAAEIRAANDGYNHTRGAPLASSSPIYSRVTGNFVGTTDEIIQWAACKWGIDEDIVRAQTVKESWWFQRTGGDFTTDPNRCATDHGIGVDGVPGQCPESAGVQQVRLPYHAIAFPWSSRSTAYNLDYAMATRRNCFEGNETWLNQFERGRDYVAGDMWGCVGLWFSGRWYTADSVTYLTDVQTIMGNRVWETPGFIGAT